jgi:hypothetical protein
MIPVGGSCFLKLDLQGWEMNALRGARQLLKKIDLILIEVSFYAQQYEPSISEVVAFMNESGFDLYDIASGGCPEVC